MLLKALDIGPEPRDQPLGRRSLFWCFQKGFILVHNTPISMGVDDAGIGKGPIGHRDGRPFWKQNIQTQYLTLQVRRLRDERARP